MKKNQKQTCPEFAKGYVIGVDGGGTKTTVALASFEGKILKIAKSGPSNPRNLGIEKAVANIAFGIRKVLKNKKKDRVLSVFIGLPAVQEDYKSKIRKIKKELLKQKGFSQVLKNKIEIGSDQVVAFRSGTDKKSGIVLITGTGCATHGWLDEKEVKSSGWGYLADEGSAFWIGQKAFQVTLKDLDGRGPKTKITKLIFKKLGIKNEIGLIQKIYSQNPVKIISVLSVLVDEA
ncbi:N-acetylglucosamine kinase, partial [Patescibacteria group bacterium]